MGVGSRLPVSGLCTVLADSDSFDVNGVVDVEVDDTDGVDEAACNEGC